jgi:hypothetical protein
VDRPLIWYPPLDGDDMMVLHPHAAPPACAYTPLPLRQRPHKVPPSRPRAPQRRPAPQPRPRRAALRARGPPRPSNGGRVFPALGRFAEGGPGRRPPAWGPPRDRRCHRGRCSRRARARARAGLLAAPHTCVHVPVFRPWAPQQPRAAPPVSRAAPPAPHSAPWGVACITLSLGARAHACAPPGSPACAGPCPRRAAPRRQRDGASCRRSAGPLPRAGAPAPPPRGRELRDESACHGHRASAQARGSSALPSRVAERTC